MAIKVKVDHESCIGCEGCTIDYPDLFYINDDGVAETRDLNGDIDQDLLEEVIDECPVAAISREN